MQALKRGWKYIAVFVIALMVMLGMLVLAAKIPRSAIRANVRESAEYLCRGELFGTVAEGVEGSKIDRYADSILLAIAYQYSDRQPLTSVMWSSYYFTEYQNENDNLLDAVTYDYEPNQQYLRYWHGSNAIVRPLLTVFELREIYVLNAVLLAILAVLLLVLLVRNRAFAPAIGVAAGLVLTAVWYVPRSLEYTWTYLLMLLMSIVAVKLALKGKQNRLGFLFLVGGMVTNYLDFLTTETLTLLVPLLLILWFDRQKKAAQTFPTLLKRAGKPVLAWGCGYVGMWVMKWVTASVVLGENVLPYVSGHIEERLGGDIGVSLWRYITGAVTRNIGCLFPFEYGVAGKIAGAALLLAVIYVAYVYHRKQICKEWILLYAFVGLVPYVRYIVLHNHSYLHFFFTYRAQMATVLAVVLILEELTEWRWVERAKTGKRRSGAVNRHALPK